MAPQSTISFKISSMDSLGQGVSKETNKITFIPKTFIGDEGKAEIISEKKGVAFARMKSLSNSSSARIEPSCPHFSSCPSCHYLHVSYEDELKIKEEALKRLAYKLNPPSITLLGSPQRLEYRNRIQLHYNLLEKKLGFFDHHEKTIIPVPQCSIAIPQISEELRRLYAENTWTKEAPQNSTTGHLEIYWLKNKLQVSWNKPYAEGGFTQVFETMNQKLKEHLRLWMQDKSASGILDLFAGNGNLSQQLNYSQRLCVDKYLQIPGEDFYSQDLYHNKALSNVTKLLAQKKFQPGVLLLDPPRSGLKNLQEWCEAIRPKSIAYVSCDPHTMARDLSSLNNYQINHLFLIDFFPSTFHFETMVFLEEKT